MDKIIRELHSRLSRGPLEPFYFYFYNFLALLKGPEVPFLGWGRKRTGQWAVRLARWRGRKFILLEDGFIRSFGLGSQGAAPLSIVADDRGIYYDATEPSRLEHLLNQGDFVSDRELMDRACEAITTIRQNHISKYNPAAAENKYDFMGQARRDKKSVLVIAQTQGDLSLKYGMGDLFSTDEVLKAARKENPDATLYIKIHPDVLSGRKKSDISPRQIPGDFIIIDEDIEPYALLQHIDIVYTKTSQMGFEALLAGRQCVCFGVPFYAGWGVTDDRVPCKRRKAKRSVEEIFAAAYLLYSDYFDLQTGKPSDIFGTLSTIIQERERRSSRDPEAYFFGFSLWKHSFIRSFMPEIKTIHFINPLFRQDPLEVAKKKGLGERSQIYLWGKRRFDTLEVYAKTHGIALFRMEDGFVRSVGLGSDLTRPYSLVVDGRGIYFDPAEESDLEHLLNFHTFTQEELDRAKRLRRFLVENQFSKYNHSKNSVVSGLPKKKKILLVPGQVEDDASICYGAKGMNNLQLLQKVRAAAPEAYLIYKPHPDVLAKNRVGSIEKHKALRYCDRIVGDISLESLLSVCDEVHTMTSLAGFEAILRNLKVYTYGLPFYAGWGVTIDALTCERRKRVLSVDALVFAALVLYPRYVDPVSKERCEVEVMLEGLLKEKRSHRESATSLWIRWRSLFIRKSQTILRILHQSL